MGPVVIIIADEVIQTQRPVTAVTKAAPFIAFLLDGPKEAFHLPVGLRAVRADERMTDAQRRTGFGKQGDALRVVGMAHGKAQGIIGQDGLNGIAVVLQGAEQEVGGCAGGGGGVNATERLPREVIQDRKLMLRGQPSTERHERFHIQMEQFSRRGFLIPLDVARRRRVQVLPAVPTQRAVDTRVAYAQVQGDAQGAPALAAAEGQDLVHHGLGEAVGAAARARRLVGQPADALRLIAAPPFRQGLTAPAEQVGDGRDGMPLLE